jgi:hypothetical protein
MVPPPTAGTPPPAQNDAGSQAPNSAEGPAAKPDPWAPLLLQVDELREYFSYYLGARADLVRARVRRFVFAAIALFIGAVAAATFAATSAALLLVGLGEGLGRLLGDRIWLGNSLVGALVLIFIGLGGLLAARWLSNTSRLRTTRTYAQRRERQRRQFGRDVSSRTRPH